MYLLFWLRSASVRGEVIHEHKKDESWFRTLGPMFLDYWQENRRILTSSTLDKLALSRERVQWISKKKKENLDSRHSPPIFLELEPENLRLSTSALIIKYIYSNWNFNISLFRDSNISSIDIHIWHETWALLVWLAWPKSTRPLDLRMGHKHIMRLPKTTHWEKKKASTSSR